MEQKIKQEKGLSIGGNLKKLRNGARMTQEQVAAQLQFRNFAVTRSAYSQMESGTYSIRVGELIALVEIFRTDFNTVFKDLNYNQKSEL